MTNLYYSTAMMSLTKDLAIDALNIIEKNLTSVSLVDRKGNDIEWYLEDFTNNQRELIFEKALDWIVEDLEEKHLSPYEMEEDEFLKTIAEKVIDFEIAMEIDKLTFREFMEMVGA